MYDDTPKEMTMNEITPPGALVEAPVSAMPAPMTPMAMIAHAVANGAPIETMEKLMALQERWEANEARKAYVAAMTAFKADPPTIGKNKHVKFDTSKGRTEYDHATLDNVCQVIGAALAKHGLSYRWETKHLDAGTIEVTCITTHVLGHSERTTLRGGADNSGGKNAIQAVGSTVTYLERYTLLAAVGLATSDQDDDGATDGDRISMDDVRALQDQLAATGGDIAKFCEYLKVGSLAEIAVRDLPRAKAAIAAKRKRGGQ